MDSTFYATPAEHIVRGWAEKVPAGFTFAPKLPRDLIPGAGGGAGVESPMEDEGDPLRRFCDVAQALGPKLGPVLIQLGPEVGPDRWPAVERFVAGLPSEMRWAIEFRQRGWVGPKLLELLRAHRVALVLVEGGGRSFRREETIELAIHPTADFAYVRWIGSGPRIEDVSAVRINRDKELSVWAMALAALAARVTSVYGYFSNHFQGHSPASARMMQQLIGQKPVEPAELGPQTSLFQL